MHIGDVDHGFNYVNIKKLLNVAQISENECKNCWAQLFCTSCCKFSDNNGELDAKFRLAQCPNMKATADDTLKKMILISEIKNVYGRNQEDKQVCLRERDIAYEKESNDLSI